MTSARARLTRADEIVGGRERVGKAGADRLQVEGDGRAGMPSLRCTAVAVAGKVWSGVEVATRIRSTSLRAYAGPVEGRAGGSHGARSEVSSPSAAMWRWPMPVRSRIHSSEVSTRCDSSTLVTTRAGR